MKSLKDRIEDAHARQRAIEAEIASLYAESLTAPAEDKACPDWMAEEIKEPMQAMRYPIEVGAIAQRSGDGYQSDRMTGKFVAVRPCGEGKEKTHLGVCIGRIAMFPVVTYDRAATVLHVGFGGYNPAIWVPDLGRLVLGAESWWSVLKKPEDLRQIADADIEGVWYVKVLRALEQEA